MPSLASRYAESLEYLVRAEHVIPLASQTFSKSRTQYPVGAAPLFATRSKGSRTWDVDGNEYVDLVSSLGAVALGLARWCRCRHTAAGGGGEREPGTP